MLLCCLQYGDSFIDDTSETTLRETFDKMKDKVTNIHVHVMVCIIIMFSLSSRGAVLLMKLLRWSWNISQMNQTKVSSDILSKEGGRERGKERGRCLGSSYINFHMESIAAAAVHVH